MKRFGSPMISVQPKPFINKRGYRVEELPIHDLGRIFQFSSEEDANNFIETMTGRIKVAADLLQKSKDNFTSSTEIEL